MIRLHSKIIIALIFILAFACASFAATISYNASIPLSQTNWTTSISIPKFDPSLGTLNNIIFVLTGHVEGSAAFESRDAAPATVTMNLSAVLSLMRPDSTIIVISLPVVSTVDNVTAFDGVPDYGGTSGKTYNNLTANHVATYTSPPPASDLALFTGVGNILLPVSAVGASNGSGAGNLDLRFNTYASAAACVTYDYTPIPEPSGLLALVSGIGGLAGFVGFKRR